MDLWQMAKRFVDSDSSHGCRDPVCLFIILYEVLSYRLYSHKPRGDRLVNQWSI